MGEGPAGVIRVELEAHERQLLSIALDQYRRDMGTLHADNVAAEDLHRVMLLLDPIDDLQRALGVTDPSAPHSVGEGAATVELSDDQRQNALVSLWNYKLRLRPSLEAMLQPVDNVVAKLGGDPGRGGLW